VTTQTARPNPYRFARVARARAAFLRALHTQTPALSDLLARARAMPREEDRGATAQAWVQHWHVAAPWVATWASLVIASWHRFEPEEYRSLLDDALSIADTGDVLTLEDFDEADVAYRLESELRQWEMDPPNPLMETAAEFRARCDAEWAKRVDFVEGEGGRPEPDDRVLEQRCEWFVRHQVHDHRATDIAKDNPSIDVSTINTGIRLVAALTGIPRRSSRGRPALKK